MKSYFHIAALVLGIGIFFMPMRVFACGNRTTKMEHDCCKKEKFSLRVKKMSDCCSKKISTHSTCAKNNENKENKDCDGNCKRNCCPCAPSHFSFTVPSLIEWASNNIYIQTKEQNTSYTESYISSGFLSIWLPPKLV